MTIVKPNLPQLTVADVESRFRQLTRLTEAGRAADGSLDLAKVDAQVQALGDAPLTAAWNQLRSDFTPSARSGSLASTQAKEFLALLQSTVGAVKPFDEDQNGRITWGEDKAPIGASSRAGDAVAEFISAMKEPHQVEYGVWRRAMYETFSQQKQRATFDQTFVDAVQKRAQTPEAAEALLWTVRAHVAEERAAAIDAGADVPAPSTTTGLPLEIRRLLMPSPAMSDSAVKELLKTDDLAAYTRELKAKVEEQLGSWDDYVAGKDLPGVAHLNDPDLAVRPSVYPSGGS